MSLCVTSKEAKDCLDGTSLWHSTLGEPSTAYVLTRIVTGKPSRVSPQERVLPLQFDFQLCDGLADQRFQLIDGLLAGDTWG